MPSICYASFLVHAGYRLLLQPPLDILIDSPATPPTVSIDLSLRQHSTKGSIMSTYRAALFNGGSITFVAFFMPGSTRVCALCTAGDTRANPRFHRGPHFAACAAKRSSAPGMKKRRGEAVAKAPAPTMTPVERVKA